MGIKDIIKIDAEIEINLDVLGYLDPNITVNIIKDGRLAEKKHLSLPEQLTNIIKCKNPRCITTIEQEVDHVFRLANEETGLYRCCLLYTSGRAIFPVALRMVYQVAEAVNLPIIGMGGVATADDVIEMMMAGATAVQVGAENLRNPFACKEIIEALPGRMAELGISSLREIIGCARR